MSYSEPAASDDQLAEEEFDMLEDHLAVKVLQGREGRHPSPPPPPPTPPPRTTPKNRDSRLSRGCGDGRRHVNHARTFHDRNSLHLQHLRHLRAATDTGNDAHDCDRRSCLQQPHDGCHEKAREEQHQQCSHQFHVNNNHDDVDDPTESLSGRFLKASSKVLSAYYFQDEKSSKVTQEAGCSEQRRTAPPKEATLNSRLKVGQSLSEHSKEYRRVEPRTLRAKKTLSDSHVSDKVNANHTNDRVGTSLADFVKQEATFTEGAAMDDDELSASDVSLVVSEVTVMEINNMSEYQLAVLGNDASKDMHESEQKLHNGLTDTASSTKGCQLPVCRNVNDSTTMMEDVDDPRTSAVVAELVGGLDSHIRALCRNLASLLLPDRWLTGEATSQRPPTPAPGLRSPNDVKVVDLVSALDDDRYYDCLSSYTDVTEVPPDGCTLDTAVTRTLLHTTELHDVCTQSSTEYNSLDKSSQVERKSSPKLSRVAATFGSDSQKVARGVSAGIVVHSHDTMAQLRGQRGQDPEQKEKSVKVNQVRSMLALLSRSREEPSNVVEISAESPDVAEMDWSGRVETEGNGGLVAGGAGQQVASWNSPVLRELSQVLDQSDVLKGMWNNHKMQLAEVLASRDRESARAGRLEQGLARARHMIQSLRCQRRHMHQYLEQKEEEWATALRCHRNEATFLRRKLLVGLEEKKHFIADPKKDGRLAAILDSLLALHMEREHFLALDLAKQNKINELKLLAIRQQLSMEELKERNMELTNALSLLLQCLPHTGPGNRLPSPSNPRSASSSTARGVSGGGSWGSSTYRGSDMTDLLYCDRAVYLPRQSTCPDLVAIRVYSIGGEQSHLASAVEDTCDVNRQHCAADGDHHHIDRHHHNQIGHDRSLAEDLLRELSLYGPGSPNFTLADVQ